MSRKNRPHSHEPAASMSAADTEVPIEETLEVGSVGLENTTEFTENLEGESVEVGDVVLVEDPMTGEVEVGTVLMVEDFVVDGVTEEDLLIEDAGTPPLNADLGGFRDFNDASYSGVMPAQTPDLGAAADAAKDKVQDAVGQASDAAGQLQDKVQDKAQDMAQNVTQTAQDLSGKAQDAAQDIAGKVQDTAQGIAGKAQDLTQTAADKAKDAAQKIADKAGSVKSGAAEAGTASKSAVAGAASTVGMGLWSVIQRSPLQAIFFIFSLVWLLRNNGATAAQTPVSVTDAAGNAAEKVGTLSGQVQVAATNLGSQVQTQAQHGAGWFSKTLQENPLVIGAMAIIAGAGIGLAVPETAYENKTLGKTRDDLFDKATVAASDLTQKVTTVAQTAVHDAIESGKAEAKNQGLAPQGEAPQEQAPQGDAPQGDAPQEQNQQQ